VDDVLNRSEEDRYETPRRYESHGERGGHGKHGKHGKHG
jgi:hypothetical protein